jgi:putative alpha-1,2-mannosidase
MIKVLSFLLFGVNLVTASSKCGLAYDLVNPFIASGGPGFGYGAVNPGAQYPLSPLRVGPDTMSSVIDINYQHFSGYLYIDTIMRAFSHTHVVGAGVVDLGTIGLMPFHTRQNNLNDSSRKFFWSNFRKETERASPGLYSVFLDEPQATVELLGIGTHAAIHKYSWASTILSKATENPGFVLDMCHSARMSEGLFVDSHCINATVAVDPTNPNIFKASVLFNGGLSGQRWYYIYGEVSSNVLSYQVSKWRSCTNFTLNAACSDSSETNSLTGTLFTVFSLGRRREDSFPIEAENKDLEVEVRVGLSWISVDQAKLNLEQSATIDGAVADYQTLRDRTVDAWCDTLQFLSVESLEGDDDIKTMLYSASYRTMMSPSRYNEAGDLYYGADMLLHNVTADRIAQFGDTRVTNPHSFEFYSDFSFWDTFRTQHPWLLLINEDIAVGIARSASELTAQMGAFPRWIMGNHESGCMLGEHGSALIVEAVQAGLGDYFDVLTVQKALLLQSTEPVPVNGRTDVEHYMAEVIDAIDDLKFNMLII